jgi:hypothetical protein
MVGHILTWVVNDWRTVNSQERKIKQLVVMQRWFDRKCRWSGVRLNLVSWMWFGLRVPGQPEVVQFQRRIISLSNNAGEHLRGWRGVPKLYYLRGALSLTSSRQPQAWHKKIDCFLAVVETVWRHSGMKPTSQASDSARLSVAPIAVQKVESHAVGLSLTCW